MHVFYSRKGIILKRGGVGNGGIGRKHVMATKNRKQDPETTSFLHRQEIT